MNTGKCKASLVAFAATTSLLFSVTCAWADVIYDNFGPGDTYTVNIGSPVSEAGPSHNLGTIDVANAFTPVGTSYSLDSIKLAVGLILGANELDVAIMSDSGGEPGDVLESFHFVGGMGDFGNNNPPLVANSLLHPILSANMQYWLFASAPVVDELAEWNHNSVGADGLHAVRSNLGQWVLTNTAQGTFDVFSVTGTPVSEIPESSTLLLLAVGLLGLAASRRKGFATASRLGFRT